MKLEYLCPHHLDTRVYFFYVSLQEREEAFLGTGLITWDGAVVLAKYMEWHPSAVSQKRILEVGAGTGVAGMAAALLGASSVLLTGEYID